MIEILNSCVSEELLGEIKAIEENRNQYFENLNYASTLEAYCRGFASSTGGLEFFERMQFPQPMKILDIGFGKGETSLLLASRRHTVHAIEPSPLNCEILQAAMKKYRLENKIKIYQCAAEDIGQLEEKGFDLCLFNSSLHHCDNPLKALENCKHKLNENGKVMAINEPILKFYRNKKWFFKTLKENPISLGHYGGNEHIYFFNEYIEMFKNSGFTVKTHFHVHHKAPREIIKDNIISEVKGQLVYSDLKLVIKHNILFLIKILISNTITKKIAIYFGKKLSLFAFSFEGSNTISEK